MVTRLANSILHETDKHVVVECCICDKIKGYFKEDAVIKWKQFKSDYPRLKKQLLMKSELKELGVL